MISQEEQIDPPLKRFWGPISMGLVILFLGVTILFPSAKDPEAQHLTPTSETTGTLPFVAEPNKKAIQAEPNPLATDKAVEIIHFQLEGIEERLNMSQKDLGQPTIVLDSAEVLDPAEGDYFNANKNDYPFDKWLYLQAWRHHSYEVELFKTLPLVKVSKDGQVVLQGELSFWVSGNYILWNLDVDVTATQTEGNRPGHR